MTHHTAEHPRNSLTDTRCQHIRNGTTVSSSVTLQEAFMYAVVPAQLKVDSWEHRAMFTTDIVYRKGAALRSATGRTLVTVLQLRMMEPKSTR